MKKMNFFGKELSVLMLGVLLVAGMGSAALVGFLSNVISGNAALDSPVEVYVAADPTLSENWGSVATGDLPADSELSQSDFSIGTVLGGTGADLWIKIDNNAEARVDEYLVIEITNNIGLSDGEVAAMIEGLTVYDWDNSGSSLTERLVDGSTAMSLFAIDHTSGSNTARVYAPVYLFEESTVGDIVYANVDFAFPLNAYGTYTVKAAVLDEPTSSFTA